jgi:membrane-associated phospholipid phosphatase
MKTSKRILFFCLIILTQALYLPLNRFLQGGTAIYTPLDALIPIIPYWSIPYLLWMICWFCLCFWAALKMPVMIYKSYFTSTILVILSAMVVYLFFPTFVNRQSVQGTGFGVDLLRWIYSNDGLYNAFPSGHIYLVTLTTIFYSRWKPGYSWFWYAILLVVSCSTLFTGQHYIVDVIGGVVFALIGAYVGTRFVERIEISKTDSPKETIAF